MMAIKFFDESFISRFNDAVTIWQNETGKTLERFDAERLIIQICCGAIQHSLENANINANMVFLRNMTGTMLDDYGADYFGVSRLASQAAVSVVRFTFTHALLIPTYIYENTIVSGSNSNGSFTFKVTQNYLVPVGSTYYDIEVEEFVDGGTNSGADANGIEIGSLNTLDTTSYDYSFVDTVENTTESYNGLDLETDDHYRDRIRIATAKYSTAGSKDAYIYHAKSASQIVADVNLNKSGWDINIYLLPKNFDGSYVHQIVNDNNSQLATLEFATLDLTDTDDGVLYWDLTDAAGTRTFTLYNAPTKLAGDQVATGARVGDGILTFLPVGVYTAGGTVDITFLSNDTDTANQVITYYKMVYDVDYIFNTLTNIRPLNDIVTINLAEQYAFSITNITVVCYSGYSIATITNSINNVVNTWSDNLKVKLGQDVIKSQLIGYIMNIEGIKSCTITFSTGTENITVAENQVAICTYSSAVLSISGGADV